MQVSLRKSDLDALLAERLVDIGRATRRDRIDLVEIDTRLVAGVLEHRERLAATEQHDVGALEHPDALPIVANFTCLAGLFTHPEATSLAEALLFRSGAIGRIGTVEAGTTVTDYDPEEIERGISIQAALAHCETNGKHVTFIDTPGAYPGVGAEERGQAQVIAQSMLAMSRMPTPIICIVILLISKYW